jgi:sulfur carrier protein
LNVTVNDQLHTLEPESTITDLLEQLGITVRHVAVEVNGDLVPRERHPDFQLSNEDRVEVVTLVGGG